MQPPLTIAPSFASASATEPSRLPGRRRTRASLVAIAIAFAGLGGAAWLAAYGKGYAPGSDLTYGLGLVGGSMLLVLLLYPLRKRLPFLQRLGALKHWFRVHMACGICGPVLIVLHSGFHVGSLNALVALSCMILVATSGLVGRFIYRRIHRGLYGRRTTQREAEEALARDLAALSPQVRDVPAVKMEIERFGEAAAHHPRTAVARTVHFIALGSRRRRARRRVRHAIAASAIGHAHDAGARARLDRLVATADEALLALQRTAQFAAYERLFALWHVLHVPFVYMLGISAVVHVVAVHAY
jgi:hypothetical protein